VTAEIIYLAMPEVLVLRVVDDAEDQEAEPDASFIAGAVARIAWAAANCGVDIDRIEAIVRAVAVGVDRVVEATAEPCPEGGPGMIVGLYEDASTITEPSVAHETV
jgi:hypothetical protein